MKGLKEESSPLEETFLKRNPHFMVIRGNGKKKEIRCVSNAKNRDIKYDCPLYKSEAKRRIKKAMMATWSEVKNPPKKKRRKKWQTCASWQ